MIPDHDVCLSFFVKFDLNNFLELVFAKLTIVMRAC